MRRIALYLAIALLGVMIWNQWQKDYPPAAVVQAQQIAKSNDKAFVPSTYDPTTAGKNSPSSATSKNSTAPMLYANTQGDKVRVQTKLLDITFNTQGGNIVSANLLKYPVSLENKTPIEIMSADSSKLYVAESGVTNTGPEYNSGAPVNFGAPNVTVDKGTTTVIFSGKSAKGLTVTKTYIFQDDSYAIKQSTEVKNTTASNWSGSFYNQITRRNIPMETTSHARSYNGAAISSPLIPYEQLSFDNLNKNNLSRDIKGGWIAMQQQYFLSTWVPNKDAQLHYYSHVVGDGEKGKDNVFTIGYVGAQESLKPGASTTATSTFYVGPEIASNLDVLAKGLSLTIDYGWLWWLSIPIFWIMKNIYSVLGNWGWTIIAITILIKAAFYGLSNKSYRSMAKMKDLQPRLQALKERFGDDKQALGKATMEFYKKEKVNPMGGCLPMLIQVPVFIALYFVLVESVQLRQAPFIFWIHDLTIKDPFFVLPLLMGVTMFVQQKLSPPPPDPTQAKVMMMLPVVFTVFFCTFPAGLVLYWLMNNLLSVLQQWYVMKSFDPKKDTKKNKTKAIGHKKK